MGHKTWLSMEFFIWKSIIQCYHSSSIIFKIVYRTSSQHPFFIMLFQIKNKASGACIDSMGRKSGEKVGLVHCHGMGGNQVRVAVLLHLNFTVNNDQIYMIGIFEPCHEIMVLFVLPKLILQTCMRSHPVGLDI